MNKNEFIKKYHMKELLESDGFEIDIIYSTSNNFTSQILYDIPICLLREKTAKSF